MLYYPFISFIDLLSFNGHTFTGYIKVFQACKRLYTYLEDFYIDLEVERSDLDDKSNKDLAQDKSQDRLIVDFETYSHCNSRHDLPYVSFTDELG